MYTHTDTHTLKCRKVSKTLGRESYLWGQTEEGQKNVTLITKNIIQSLTSPRRDQVTLLNDESHRRSIIAKMMHIFKNT